MIFRAVSSLILSAFCLFHLGSGPVWAVPAAPIVHELKQPEGNSFSARQWGDEHQSGWETEEGYTIIHDRVTGHWSYPDQDEAGNLVPSNRHVGKHSPDAEEKKHLRPKGEDSRKKSLDGVPQSTPPEVSVSVSASANSAELPPAAAPPRTGSVNIPVILVNFSDTTPTYTPADFINLLFGTGIWSMKDFYTEASYGQYSVTPGPAGVIGWVTAINNHDFYGQDGTTPLGGSTNNLWIGDLVYEAVQAADATVDFSAYDMDGDCYVDIVVLAHQGTGQEASGNANDIWSHSWSLQSARYYGQSHYLTYTAADNYGAYTTNDTCVANPAKKVKINKYVIQPEKFSSGMSTVGVYAHEFGHFLGLPDLYDTDSTSRGIGSWSLMAGGSWNGTNGDRPAMLDAWSRSMLGWATPTKITGSSTGKTFPSVLGAGNIYQFLNGTPGSSGEYFLVENRQKDAASFDSALPGAGLLLWHIDEAKNNNTAEWYPGCTTCTGHYKVALVQADGLYSLEKNLNGGSSGDPFFGGGVRSVGHTTFPANDLYSGADSGFALACISPSSSQMSADIYFGGLPNASLTITKTGGGSGTVTGSAGGLSCGATCGATFPVCSSVTLTAAPDTGYYFTGWSGGGCSGTGTCTPTLTGAQEIFAGFVPPVTSLTESFISLLLPAGWSLVDNAGTGKGWTFNDPGARGNLTGSSGGFAIMDSDKAGSVAIDAELRTPLLNFSSANKVSLSFKTDFRWTSNHLAEVADVDVSVNGAAGPWNNVWRKAGASYRGPKTETIDISTLAAHQSQVMVRFHYYNANYEWWWQVDDVTIIGLDTQTPDTMITTQPAVLANTSSGSFSFISTEADSTFECALDGVSYAVCTTPYYFSSLGDGNHSFTVRAKNTSGTMDPTPASYLWLIDSMPPDTLITAQPANPASTGSGSFSFTSDDASASFECSLDGAVYAACSTPYAFSGLADGNHTFSVRAKDPAGNIDLSPASVSWTIKSPAIPIIRAVVSGQPDVLYSSLADALAAVATSSDTVFQLKSGEISGDYSLLINSMLYLNGGYDASLLLPVEGTVTTLRGTLTISSGMIVARNVVVKSL